MIDGLEADVVTLALSGDIDAIAEKSGRSPSDWQKRLPNNSAPYTSTIVFVVRKGNPKGIKDWGDLAKPGIAVITPNPKTSGRRALELPGGVGLGRKAVRRRPGQGRPSSSAALQERAGAGLRARAGRRSRSRSAGSARCSIAWENEAYYLTQEMGKDKFEIVTPSISILAEPSVAVVDKNVDKRGTRAVAEAYLKFLYTPEGQELAAKHYYRPRDPACREAPRGPLREGDAVDHRRGVRRVGQGAEAALRRRRDLRQAVQARLVIRSIIPTA